MNVELVALEHKTEKPKIQAVHKSVSVVSPKGIIKFKKKSLYCQKVGTFYELTRNYLEYGPVSAVVDNRFTPFRHALN